MHLLSDSAPLDGSSTYSPALTGQNHPLSLFLNAPDNPSSSHTFFPRPHLQLDRVLLHARLVLQPSWLGWCHLEITIAPSQVTNENMEHHQVRESPCAHLVNNSLQSDRKPRVGALQVHISGHFCSLQHFIWMILPDLQDPSVQDLLFSRIRGSHWDDTVPFEATCVICSHTLVFS